MVPRVHERCVGSTSFTKDNTTIFSLPRTCSIALNRGHQMSYSALSRKWSLPGSYFWKVWAGCLICWMHESQRGTIHGWHMVGTLDYIQACTWFYPLLTERSSMWMVMCTYCKDSHFMKDKVWCIKVYYLTNLDAKWVLLRLYIIS